MNIFNAETTEVKEVMQGGTQRSSANASVFLRETSVSSVVSEFHFST